MVQSIHNLTSNITEHIKWKFFIKITTTKDETQEQHNIGNLVSRKEATSVFISQEMGLTTNPNEN